MQLPVGYKRQKLECSAQMAGYFFFFFSSRRRHTRFDCDWSSDVCSSDLKSAGLIKATGTRPARGAVEHFYELTDRGQAAMTAIENVLGMTPPPAPRGAEIGRASCRERV